MLILTFRWKVRRSGWTYRSDHGSLRFAGVEQKQQSGSHIHIRMHALYCPRYKTQLSIHDLLCTLELQICYNSVALKVRDSETWTTERNELLVST